jgi:hypothetical protein
VSNMSISELVAAGYQLLATFKNSVEKSWWLAASS